MCIYVYIYIYEYPLHCFYLLTFFPSHRHPRFSGVRRSKSQEVERNHPVTGRTPVEVRQGSGLMNQIKVCVFWVPKKSPKKIVTKESNVTFDFDFLSVLVACFRLIWSNDLERFVKALGPLTKALKWYRYSYSVHKRYWKFGDFVTNNSWFVNIIWKETSVFETSSFGFGPKLHVCWFRKTQISTTSPLWIWTINEHYKLQIQRACLVWVSMLTIHTLFSHPPKKVWAQVDACDMRCGLEGWKFPHEIQGDVGKCK